MLIRALTVLALLQAVSPARANPPAETAKLAQLDAVTRQVVRTLPAEWQIVQSAEIPPAQREAIGGRLGTPLEALANAVFTVFGKRIQVNTLVTASDEAAEALRASSAARHGISACGRGRRRSGTACPSRRRRSASAPTTCSGTGRLRRLSAASRPRGSSRRSASATG